MTPCPRCGHWISERWVHHCPDVVRTSTSSVTDRPRRPRDVQTAKLDQLRERWKGDMDR